MDTAFMWYCLYTQRNSDVNKYQTPLKWRFGYMSSSGLELFYWHRSEGGYEWQDAKALPELQGLSDEDREETRFLIRKPMETPLHWRYNPLVKYPTLYREFAALEPTEAAYAAFANAYGDLGVGLLIERSGPMVEYDPFHRWRTAHRMMRPVVDVLTAIQDRSTVALRQWFTVVNNGARYERREADGSGSVGWVTIADQHREFIWKWAMEADSDDAALTRIAQGWAQDQINSAMGNSDSGTLTSARVIFEIDRKRMALHISPDSLLAALWLQCARILTLNPTFKSCEHCRTWFELSPETRRKQSKYCSSRCKVAAYRARKADGVATSPAAS